MRSGYDVDLDAVDKDGADNDVDLARDYDDMCMHVDLEAGVQCPAAKTYGRFCQRHEEMHQAAALAQAAAEDEGAEDEGAEDEGARREGAL